MRNRLAFLRQTASLGSVCVVGPLTPKVANAQTLCDEILNTAGGMQTRFWSWFTTPQASRYSSRTNSSSYKAFTFSQVLLGSVALLPFLANAAGTGIISQGAATFPVNSAQVCARPAPGSKVAQPLDLYSSNGLLSVKLSYFATVDYQGPVFCFQTPEGNQSPTLHVKPGDVLELEVTNRVPRGSQLETLTTQCGESVVFDSSLNVHFHGTLVSPLCTKDDVVDTVINSGDTFRYLIPIPANEPSGLFFYHPHLHGLADAALLGGATGALVIDGIQNFYSDLSGMPERILTLRGAATVGAGAPGSVDINGLTVPTWDVSVNYVPVVYSPVKGAKIEAAKIEMQYGRSELWRVVNASSDALYELEVVYDGVPQPLRIVALDGVPTGSQDGTRAGKSIIRNKIALPTAARAEFVVAPPGPGVLSAELRTLKIDTGPVGDSDPKRTLALIQTSVQGTALPVLPVASLPAPQRFEDLQFMPVTARRKLYFSEVLSNPNNAASPTNFYITVDGAKPTLYSPSLGPAIITNQGAVEEWTIENRSTEKHVFHIHQIHFKLQEVNGVPVSTEDSQFYDDYTVDYYHGKVDGLGNPIDANGNIISNPTYPSIKVKMDFRGPIAGDFVFHCHILQHEDAGMMAKIRVLP